MTSTYSIIRTNRKWQHHPDVTARGYAYRTIALKYSPNSLLFHSLKGWKSKSCTRAFISNGPHYNPIAISLIPVPQLNHCPALYSSRYSSPTTALWTYSHTTFRHETNTQLTECEFFSKSISFKGWQQRSRIKRLVDLHRWVQNQNGCGREV
jgi:hypothetical protein